MKNLELVQKNLLPLILRIGEFNKLEVMDTLNILVSDNIDEEHDRYTVSLMTTYKVKKEVLEKILTPFLEQLCTDNLINSYRIWGSKKEFDLELI